MDDNDFRESPYTALLFDAADLLERRAERCIPGPWVVDGRDVVPEDDEYGEIATCRESSHDEADWIAMVDPSIAPELASTLRYQGCELYLNVAASGDTASTRSYVRESYGDLLVLAWKLLGRPKRDWFSKMFSDIVK